MKQLLLEKAPQFIGNEKETFDCSFVSTSTRRRGQEEVDVILEIYWRLTTSSENASKVFQIYCIMKTGECALLGYCKEKCIFNIRYCRPLPYWTNKQPIQKEQAQARACERACSTNHSRQTYCSVKNQKSLQEDSSNHSKNRSAPFQYYGTLVRKYLR